MKHLFFLSLLSLLIVSCNKYDMPRVPDPPAYGTITFNEVPDNSTTTTVATYDSKKTLYIYSVICAPSPGGMQTRIFAWNGYSGAACRTLIMNIQGSEDNFPLENSSVNFVYSKGLNQYGFALFDPNASSPQTSKNYAPPFALTKSEFASTEYASFPVNFSKFDVFVPANERKISGFMPSVTVGSTALENFTIDVQSFGGILTSLNKCMTFDVDGKPCGSFVNQVFNAVGEDKKPGISSLQATFNADIRNPLVSITFDFVHHSSKLAYTGPVGKYDLSDGTGYTEIKINAVDQNGVVYREQKGKGFVRVLYEKPWSLLVSFPTNTIFPGDLLMEFEAELVSETGSTVTLTNGNAYYTILQ